MSIYRDSKVFDKNLVTFGKTNKERNEIAHSLAVSALFHTAEHRQLDPKDRTDKLHRFYDALKRSDQDALRGWISALIMRTELDATGKETRKYWLRGSKDDAGVYSFHIVPTKSWAGSEIASKAFADNIDEIDKLPAFFDHEPSERKDKPFSFGEESLIRAINALVEKAKKGHDETHEISDGLLSAVESAKVMIEAEVSKGHHTRPIGASKLPADTSETREPKTGAKPGRETHHGGRVVETQEQVAA